MVHNNYSAYILLKHSSKSKQNLSPQFIIPKASRPAQLAALTRVAPRASFTHEKKRRLFANSQLTHHFDTEQLYLICMYSGLIKRKKCPGGLN